MRLRRSARRHQAGIDDSTYAFNSGDRVLTEEGLLGRVVAVEDGPFGDEHYIVELDHDMGGGEYSSSELRHSDSEGETKTADIRGVPNWIREERFEGAWYGWRNLGRYFFVYQDSDRTWSWGGDPKEPSDPPIVGGKGFATKEDAMSAAESWVDGSDSTRQAAVKKASALDEIKAAYNDHKPDQYGGWQCFAVAPAIQKQWGLQAVEGFYVPEGDIRAAVKTERVYAHWWNLLPDGSILDATAGQWKRGGDNVQVISGGDPRYVSGADAPLDIYDDLLDVTQGSVFTGSKTAEEQSLMVGDEKINIYEGKIPEINTGGMTYDIGEVMGRPGEYIVGLTSWGENGLGSEVWDSDPYPSEAEARANVKSEVRKFFQSWGKRANEMMGYGDPVQEELEDADMAEDEDIYSLASDDYPELAEILTERPPLAHSERLASKKTAKQVYQAITAGGTPEDAVRIALVNVCGWKPSYDDVTVERAEQVATHAGLGTPIWGVLLSGPDKAFKSGIRGQSAPEGWKTASKTATPMGQAWVSTKCNWCDKDAFCSGRPMWGDDDDDIPEVAYGCVDHEAEVKEYAAGGGFSYFSSRKQASYAVFDDGGFVVAGPFVSRQDAVEAEKFAREEGQTDLIIQRVDLDFLGNVAALTKEGMGLFLDKFLYPVAEEMIKRQPEDIRYDPSTGKGPSYDWCRFRRSRQCYFPDKLDEVATAEAGYAVWIPLLRGFCAREAWEGQAGQKGCPVSEAGPNASRSEDPRADATYSWAEGGQRYDSSGYPVPVFPGGRYAR